jgi:hypothetical protein
LTLKVTCRPGGKRFLTPKVTCRPGGKRFLTLKVTCRPGGKRFSTLKVTCRVLGKRFLTLKVTCRVLGKRFLPRHCELRSSEAIQRKTPLHHCNSWIASGFALAMTQWGRKTAAVIAPAPVIASRVAVRQSRENVIANCKAVKQSREKPHFVIAISGLLRLRVTCTAQKQGGQ